MFYPYVRLCTNDRRKPFLRSPGVRRNETNQEGRFCRSEVPEEVHRSRWFWSTNRLSRSTFCVVKPSSADRRWPPHYLSQAGGRAKRRIRCLQVSQHEAGCRHNLGK